MRSRKSNDFNLSMLNFAAGKYLSTYFSLLTYVSVCSPRKAWHAFGALLLFPIRLMDLGFQFLWWDHNRKIVSSKIVKLTIFAAKNSPVRIFSTIKHKFEFINFFNKDSSMFFWLIKLKSYLWRSHRRPRYRGALWLYSAPLISLALRLTSYLLI